MKIITQFAASLSLCIMCVIGATSTTYAQATTPLKPGTVFRDCPECPELVVIPAGLFVMGVGAKRKAEKPVHRVNFKKPFAIGRFEVTFTQWLTCVTQGGCKHTPDDHNWGKGKRPVINITYDQAKNYLRWISKKTGKTYRLPSESEWEYVARAGTTSLYWWGNDVGENMANCKDCKSEWSAHSTAPTGSFKPNNFGVYDTAGNVFEWVEDCWVPNHKGAPNDGSARKTGDCKYQVIRGGSFYYFSKVARSVYRAKNPAGVKSYWLGFRVLRELH